MITLLTQQPLPQPERLAAPQLQAIGDSYARLARAVATDDRPLIVGSAKELVECVARVILEAQGHATSDNAEHTKVVGLAHQVVEYVTGPDMPANDPLRIVSGEAKKIAIQLAQLRNRFGTGHGRAVLHPVTDEVIEMSVHGALIWVRWALVRVDTVLLGAVPPLIADLEGKTFYGGDLAQRLAAADVPRLGESDQRRLGLAVGRRAARETHNVRYEGIDPCAEVPDAWPDAYREGIVTGLFLNEDGQIYAHPSISPQNAALVLQHHSKAEEVLGELRERLASASWSPFFVYTRQETLAAMHDAAGRLEPAAQPVWAEIIGALQDRAEK
ncbi:abortive infection family protein [Streptomyces profundus]|uniref:abortive infection family protein n=1 Tax=Streptomyces profundus TaxID=2867410 RepID=UPI001D166E76|nr:abortive infection family protein [Streptomyces sp. MA3_2.13]UED88169.1 abortive infection family protein [Streptomyces sp. MA3_2.13]